MFDVSGRRVWELPRARMEPGLHRIPWDGQDESGHPVEGGIYFVRVRGKSDLNPSARYFSLHDFSLTNATASMG